MKAIIKLTDLSKGAAVVKALNDAIQADDSLQKQIIENGILFEDLRPAEVTEFRDQLAQYEYSAYTSDDNSIRLDVESGSTDELIKLLLRLLGPTGDLSKMLWASGLVVEGLTADQANDLKKRLEAESAQVTVTDESSNQYSVSGQVRRPDNTLFSENGYTLRAFDQVDANNTVPLGTFVSLTANGTYRINYTWESTGERNGPNLQVQLFDPRGNVAAMANQQYADRQETLNLQVEVSDPVPGKTIEDSRGKKTTKNEHIMIPNIHINETSPTVALLHKMMQLLNLSVNAKEQLEQRAGEQTQNAIRDFQKQNQLPVDEQFVVDKPTINFMLGLLGQQGYLESSMRRKIKGTVQMASGKALHRTPLAAVDLDLPAVSKYKDVKTTKELIGLRDDIEFLGLAETDQNGRYEIEFYDWMYAKSERRSADVVVYALDRGNREPGENIIGHSALFQNVGYDTDEVNITIAEAVKERGEYKSLFNLIASYLEENKTNLNDISGSQEQISFVASEMDIELEKVQHIVQANSINNSIKENLEPELLYGLARQKIALDWDSLYRSSVAVLEEALAQAMEENDIDTFSKADIDGFIDTLKTVTAAKMLEPTANEPNVTNELLTLSLADQKKRVAFVKASNQYTGTDESEFWESYLPKQTGFKADTINSLRQNQKLFVLSGAHLPLVQALEQSDIKELPELVQWDTAQWQKTVAKTGVPDHVKGENDKDKIKNYATLLRDSANKEYPTAAVQHKINTNTISIEDSAVRDVVTQFLSSAQDFDIKTSKIIDFKDRIDNEAAVKKIKELQRLVRINPDTSVIPVLKNKKLTSAIAIAQIPRKTFINQNWKDFGSKEKAMSVYVDATDINTRINVVENRVRTAINPFTPSIVTSPEDRAEMEALMSEHWPGYSDVFNVNVCECGHCNSVYGPAAYFVDLMRFLGLGYDPEARDNPQVIFRERRPDLFHLPLTCENSNTLIPYIDLANEVMENFIYYTEVDVAPDGFSRYQSADTDNITETELRAQPQNIRKEAYFILAQSIFPFSLPFHLPLEILHAYSNQLGTSWHGIVEKTNDKTSDAIQRNLNAAYLHLSETEYALLTGEKIDPATAYTVPAIHQVYGLPADKISTLSQVPIFLRQTGLAYTDLVQLLYTNFINPQLYDLEYLNLLIKESDVVGSDIYENLNMLSENEDITILPGILTAISGNDSITVEEFRTWIIANFENVKEVLTLYEPTSACDLSNTQLKTLKSVHDSSEIALPENILVRIHKFIRLWRKTGWSIQDLDALLSALGNVDIDTEIIKQLSFAKQFIDETKITPKEAALLWGNFDYHRPNNLYAKLFLKKSLKINEVFIPEPGKPF